MHSLNLRVLQRLLVLEHVDQILILAGHLSSAWHSASSLKLIELLSARQVQRCLSLVLRCHPLFRPKAGQCTLGIPQKCSHLLARLSCNLEVTRALQELLAPLLLLNNRLLHVNWDVKDVLDFKVGTKEIVQGWLFVLAENVSDHESLPSQSEVSLYIRSLILSIWRLTE